MEYKYIFFDLDGTIYDSARGITASARYALKKMGVSVKDNLNKFIGPPLKSSFMEFYGMSSEDGDRAVKFYREYYVEHGIFDGELYDNVIETLKMMYDSGIKIVLATSKPQIFAERILVYFKIDQYFTFVSGASLDEKHVEKCDIISYAVNELGITDLNAVLMVGDRSFDIIGAKKVGVKSAGVLFGYGDKYELVNAGADYIVKSFNEILEIIELTSDKTC